MQGPAAKRLNSSGTGSNTRGIDVSRVLEFEDDSTNGGTNTGIGSGGQQYSDFLPIHVVFRWTLPKTSTDMVTVVMVLPQGVSDGMFEVEVVQSGMALELRVEWPTAISIHEELHTKWFTATNESMEHVDIRGNAFENALKQKRSNAHQKLFSRACFPLPFTVRSEIFDQHNMVIPPRSTAIIYVDLISAKSDYGVTKSSNVLEVL